MDLDQTQWFTETLRPNESLIRGWLRTRFPAVGEIDADDIVQEAYLRVLSARQRRGKIEQPKAFLFATVRNLALDLLRHRRVSSEKPLVESGGLRVLDESAAIPEAAARQQEIEFLTEAIQLLPERCRQIFVLRRLQGMSQREIAAHLGISDHTVSAQLTIALHKCTAYVTRRRSEKAMG